MATDKKNASQKEIAILRQIIRESVREEIVQNEGIFDWFKGKPSEMPSAPKGPSIQSRNVWSALSMLVDPNVSLKNVMSAARSYVSGQSDPDVKRFMTPELEAQLNKVVGLVEKLNDLFGDKPVGSLKDATAALMSLPAEVKQLKLRYEDAGRGRKRSTPDKSTDIMARAAAAEKDIATRQYESKKRRKG